MPEKIFDRPFIRLGASTRVAFSRSRITTYECPRNLSPIVQSIATVPHRGRQQSSSAINFLRDEHSQGNTTNTERTQRPCDYFSEYPATFAITIALGRTYEVSTATWSTSKRCFQQ